MLNLIQSRKYIHTSDLMNRKSEFRKNVLQVVSSIPKGSVISYGIVATLAGSPNSARVVGGILRSLTIEEELIPWWRVINKAGKISINQNLSGAEKEIQKLKLESEGVKVNRNYKINMRKYGWIIS